MLYKMALNRIINKLRKTSPLKLGIFTGLTFLFIIILVSIILKTNSDDDEFLAPVITIKPLYGSLEKTLRITSQVETGSLITLVPRVAGNLVMLDVKAGDEVTEGQIIAQVDSAPYDLTFIQAQSQYFTARSTFDRIGQLYSNQEIGRAHV